ncbi:MAG: response regulator [Cyanobacteria bacterium P01_C01_bin.72]
MIRVLLVDDQKMVRETLKLSLAMEKDIEIVGMASNGIAAVEQVATLHPDIVIMNMEMPGLDGASATKQITSRYVQTKVLIHTSYDNDEYITKSLAMGAKGYLLKNGETDDLAGAIRNINKGYTQIAPGLLEKLLISTDSGVVISKLEGLASVSQASVSTATLASGIKPQQQKVISNLKLASRQQQEELNKLRQSIEQNQEELPQIKKNISRYKNILLLLSLLWLCSLPLLGMFISKLYNKTNDIQLETANLKQNIQASVIPKERVGLYGEFSLHGIAQRVERAYEQDSQLGKISTVYVAQEDDAIVLFGTIPDAELLRRMENIAKEVEGVRKVYTSQVAVKPGFIDRVLGSGKYNADGNVK